MADITAAMIKDLRSRTQAGFTDCKRALVECDGDIDKAADLLRKKGLVTASKKAGRTAAAGVVHSYIHAGGKIGVLVEVNCETDFVARTDDFQAFVKDVAMQIAALNPRWVGREEVPEEAVAKEREIQTAAVIESGKPEKVVPKIVEGKLNKWYSEVCLLEQPFVKENKKSVKQLLTDLIARIGENVVIRRFVRWEVGEGITVEKKDFAEEIKEMTQS